jgi:hypothetical protein
MNLFLESLEAINVFLTKRTFQRVLFPVLLSTFSLHAEVVVFDDTQNAPGGGLSLFSGAYGSFTSDGDSGQLMSLILGLNGNPRKGVTEETIALYADNSTSPGSLLATLATVLDTAFPASGLYNVALNSNPNLDPNTRYWIGITGGSSVAGWQTTADTGTGVANEYYALGSSVISNSDQFGSSPVVMEVTETGDAVTPEPSTWAMMLTAIGVGAAYLRGRRRGKGGIDARSI